MGVLHTMYKTLKALVLRSARYKEADAVLTVLTDTEGKLTVSAHGVLGRSGRLSAACQLLTLSEMTLAESHGRLYVREAESIEQFLGLREDISALALGTYFAELLEKLSDEDSPNGEVLSLGLNCLYALSSRLRPAEQVKAVFELRLMCLAGYEPQLDYCPHCGSFEMEDTVFSTQEGTALCGSCAGGICGGTIPIGGAGLAAMRHIAEADSKKILSFTADEPTIRSLSAVGESYIRAQLDTEFPALDYWKKVK